MQIGTSLTMGNSYDEICYKNNNVSEVVCRLDLAAIIEPIKKSMPKSICDVVKNYFPIAEPQDVIGTELTINPTSGPVVNQVFNKQWVFLSRDRKNKCIIEASVIIFSITEYNVYEDLREAVINIMHSVLEEYPDIQGKRLGLRYINRIDLGGNDTWINMQFYNALMAHKDEKTTKLITHLEYAVQDKDINVRLVYGFNNPDYPAIIKRDEFVIDMDAFSQGIIYSDDIEKYIDNMHYEVQACFENMITDEYRKALNGGI